jgi:hypothetical protein
VIPLAPSVWRYSGNRWTKWLDSKDLKLFEDMGKKLTLSDYEEFRLEETRKEWLGHGLSTEPIDRDRATSIIRDIYVLLGRKKPDAILFFRSPKETLSALADYSKTRGKLRGQPIAHDLRMHIGKPIQQRLEQRLRKHIGIKLLNHLDSQLLKPLSLDLDTKLKRRLASQLDRQLWQQSSEGPWWDFSHDQYFAGQHYCAWEALFTYCSELGVPYKETDRLVLNAWVEQAKNLHWWFPYENICLASERHICVHKDGAGELHKEDGPAFAYSDGWKGWFWHGTSVSQKLIEAPETLTPQEIMGERNSEIQRVMLDRFGMENFLSASGAVLVHSHERGDLFSIETDDDEDYIKIVKVTCPSTGNRYFLRVPPHMERADDAVAWTFGFEIPADIKRYKPIVET